MSQSNFENLGQAEPMLGFDTPVVAEVNEFALLPEGEYPFKIVDVEKGYTDNPGGKIPVNTPRAILTLECDGGEVGKNKVRHYLFWTQNMMWKVAEVFISVGLTKPKETFVPNPDLLLGASGMVELLQESYTKEGQERTRNTIKRCLPPANNFGGF